MAEEKIPGPPPSELAPGAFELLAAGRAGVLSTLSARKPGWPLGSFVSYALDGVGRPIFLFTELAQHTRNLRADPRASLFVQEPGARNPQSSGRLALLGTLTLVPGGRCRRPGTGTWPSTRRGSPSPSWGTSSSGT